MRLLLDMGLARTTAHAMRAAGHDAVHLRDQGLQSLEDESIVDKAVVERRVVVTCDLDFGRIVALGRGVVPSVITLRLSDLRPAVVTPTLTEVVERFRGDLERGALVTVDDQGVRVRPLPVSAG